MPEVEEERFVRLRDGTIYGYTPLLAKRRDSVIVDGYAAAKWFKAQGVTNEITEKYPDAVPDRPSKKAEEHTEARTFINQRAIAAKAADAQKKTEQRDKLRTFKENQKAVSGEVTSDDKDGH